MITKSGSAPVVDPTAICAAARLSEALSNFSLAARSSFFNWNISWSFLAYLFCWRLICRCRTLKCSACCLFFFLSSFKRWRAFFSFSACFLWRLTASAAPRMGRLRGFRNAFRASAALNMGRSLQNPRRRSKASEYVAQISKEAKPLYSPSCREGSFSETQKAIRQEKGRGVENPGGKVCWALYRLGCLLPNLLYCDHAPKQQSCQGVWRVTLSIHRDAEKECSGLLSFRHIPFSETHGFGGMKKGRSCYAPAQWCLYALGSLAVPLRCLFDRFSRHLQVLRCHHRMDLYGRVQSEEKRLGHSGDLGGVVHVNNKVSTPCTFHVREVRSLRIDLFNDRSNSLIEGPVPGQFVSRICWEAEREHEAHALLLPTRLEETSGRLSLLYPPVTGSP